MNVFLIGLRWVLLLVGCGGFFVNERYLSAEPSFLVLRYTTLALSVLACALSLGLSLGLGVKDHGTNGRKSLFWGFAWQAGLVLGLCFYLGYLKALGASVSAETPIQKVLLGAWLVFITISLFAGIGIEWAIKQAGLSNSAEPQRVARAGLSMLCIGMLFAALAGINYTAVQRNISKDWSYLKTNSPSESTSKMIAVLTEPLSINLYYPKTNEVVGGVRSYFESLAQKQPLIKIEFIDKDMNPTKAEVQKVQRNGQIVLEFKQKRSTIETGLTLSKAKRTLKTIDREFQKAFLEITSKRKVVYFTRGHGEMTWIGESADNPTRGIRGIETYLKSQNFSTRFLGINEGSTTSVPDDASAVIIAGASDPFLKEEIEALDRYVEQGGKVMAFLDIQSPSGELISVNPSTPNPLYDWLSKTGITLVQTPLANDKNFVPMTRSASDHWFIFSNNFTSHESVINLARNDERLAVLLFGSGYLTVSPEKNGWKTSETIRSGTDTFNDENRNFKIDGEEKRNSYVIGAIAEKSTPKPGKEIGPGSSNGRIIVTSDATMIADFISTNNQGNAVFFADSLKWLVGESHLSGDLSADEDVKIRHTNKEENSWFYVTVVAVPFLVLAGGFVATRRRRSPGKEMVHAA